MTTRLKEAQKLGFKRAVIPAAGEVELGSIGLKIERITHLKELAERMAPCEGTPRQATSQRE